MINNQHFLNFESFETYFCGINFPTLNIISVNIRSISSIDKFNKFKCMISKLPKLPSVIAVQETWFSSNLVQIYNIPGYDVVHCCRSDGYGGASIYINNSLHYNVETCCSKDFIENITISLLNHKINGKSLKLTTFYRSQKCNVEKFVSFIENIVASYGRFPSIIVGDSNIDFINNTSADLINMLSSFDYKNCHTLITRPVSGTCIDNVYSNIPDELLINTIECCLTDHNIIYCMLKSNAPNSEYFEKVYRICNYERAKESLTNYLETFQETGDPSVDTSQIMSHILNATINSTVEKTEKKLMKNELTPWLNQNLQALIFYKKNLLKQRKKRDVESRLKRISNVIKKACKQSMNNFYYSHLNQIQQEPKKCWKFLNENLGRKSKSEIKVKDADGEFILDNHLKSNLFNQYFLQIPKTLKQQIDYLPGDSCNALRTLGQCQSIFNFSYTTELEIAEQISELDVTKSSGSDGISAKILKVCKDDICPYLSRIFNRMIDTSTYPHDLKIAKIIPIPKESKATLIEKFRPIALLPIIDKIFEKILYKQLSSYFEVNNLLYNCQYGFKKGCGTEEAVINVINNICKGLDDGFSGVGGIFYDLSKAFDLVDHNIMINKLEYYGVNGRDLLLIRSYLENRKQYVEVNGEKSFIGSVEYGVPQGSVLGPLLFKIYVNDIKNLQVFGKMFMYADDISLFYPYKHETALKVHMEYDAALISEYLRLNRLKLNAEKTKILRFRPYLVHDQVFGIWVDGKQVNESLSTKYLGVHLQSNLSWDTHIQKLKYKILSVIGLLYKFKNKFNTKTKLVIYQALIHSHLNYLPIIYGHKKTNEFKSLQRAQNRALKTVFNLPLTYSTIPLYKNIALTILPVHGLHKMQLLLYVFKSLNNIGHHTITFSRNQTAFNTRNNSNLRVARCRLETTKQRVEHIGSLEFNNLPENTKNIVRISIFKTNVKNYLFQNLEMLLL